MDLSSGSLIVLIITLALNIIFFDFRRKGIGNVLNTISSSDSFATLLLLARN